ncbi:RAQPRD family integrative conjugative element protein [Acidovorax sp. SUPP3334]|uniref:integrative conjugative element protein, RAQPRD family n=1 Tax=Acidovorax sp. SUPP3334 TaxID=2920881 RepID=UPI0023DE3245|nr:RAQPRD family integrative conjugative element protein [Acidovorax sp. SUPP3334]GKT26686.1 RAQPRD family integrative conjugative element protein [Acidovorax sp. SUPP3334]
MDRTHRSTLAWRPALAAVLFASLLPMGHPAAAADDAEIERERLTAIVRQLDLIDRLVGQSSAAAPDAPARYHFDYPRLNADLQRVRAGIRDYLTPQRAQPREPAALSGEYRQDTGQEGER